MPLVYKINDDPDVELSIWKVEEPISYFEKKIVIDTKEQEIIDQLSTRKRLEWMVSRYLLHIMSGRSIRGKFVKDAHGKPHLLESDYHISISHSNDYVCVMASLRLIGVDIQKTVSKITRIRHKFVSEYEGRFVSEVDGLDALHIIWGAKESLYKAYGKRGLSFINHLFVDNLNTADIHGAFTGRIEIDEFRKEFELYFTKIKEYTLVYAKESN